ncbi:hypothetical protein CHS0354_012598 [Potamilus streckersoni]|uniref:Glycosyltransferase n=1 Tax=Potamilus streckersoni TaxID=2493646 RepID=A0AAE0SXM8_9BIVA|nr:hypothetical protein CHS0354_012598 [Potamilus streckersoni]
MALKFVEALFTMILPFYGNYRHNLQRADAVRYMVLYEYGGVYADLDIVSLRPLDPIMRKYSCILSQEPHIHPVFYNNFYGLACNAFMDCRSHHPFMKTLINSPPVRLTIKLAILYAVNIIELDCVSRIAKKAHYFREEIEKDTKINPQIEPTPYEISAGAFPNNGSCRIERTIHQIWIDKTIPENIRKYVSSFRKHHRNYVYMFWTEKNGNEVCGGYVSIDSAFLCELSLPPLDPILRKYSCILSQKPHIHPVFYNNFYGLACNAFMACRSHHPFMKIVVDNLASFSVAAEVLDSTGPRFDTEAT